MAKGRVVQRAFLAGGGGCYEQDTIPKPDGLGPALPAAIPNRSPTAAHHVGSVLGGCSAVGFPVLPLQTPDEGNQ